MKRLLAGVKCQVVAALFGKNAVAKWQKACSISLEVRCFLLQVNCTESGVSVTWQCCEYFL